MGRQGAVSAASGASEDTVFQRQGLASCMLVFISAVWVSVKTGSYRIRLVVFLKDLV